MPENVQNITPAQLRAARSLLGWSQGQLARAAGVGISTVKDAEAGKRDPINIVKDVVRRTLEGGGVIFIAANGDGPGVRLRGHRPEMIRRPFSIKTEDTLAFLVSSRGKKVVVQMEKGVLERMDGKTYEEFTDYLSSFRRHEQRILEKTAKAIEENRFDGNGFVQLRVTDFD